MFMIKENLAQKERLEKIFKKIKVVYETVPPQMTFLGNIEADYLEEFLVMILRIAKHPHIDPNFFTFLRLHIAFREDYAYCKMFNTQMLQSKGYAQELQEDVINNVSNIPFDEKHKALATFAIKAIYESKVCMQSDFDTLYEMGWTQRDVFDAIEHAGTLLRNGRLLTAYSIKD